MKDSLCLEHDSFAIIHYKESCLGPNQLEVGCGFQKCKLMQQHHQQQNQQKEQQQQAVSQMNVQQHPGAWLGVQPQHPKQTTPVIRSEAFKSTSELSKNCEMTHAAHLPRRGQFGRHTAAAPAQGHLKLPTGQGDPHPHHGRHTLSLRTDMMAG